MTEITGAVNGVPVTRGVNDDGVNPFTLDINIDGSDTTIDVDTDGADPILATGGRVAIIGGETAGRDHFPFDNSPQDISPVETGPYTILPLEFDLPTACRWFYLVKRWAFNLSISYDVYDNDGVFNHSDSGSVYIELEPQIFDGTDLLAMTYEAQVVFSKLQGWSFGLDKDTPEGDGTEYFNLSWDFPTEISEGTGSLGDTHLQIGLFWYMRPFWFDSNFYYQYQLAFNAGGEEGGSFASTYAEQDGTFGDLDFDGVTIPIGVSANATVGEGNSYLFTDYDASFEPIEFWAYATRDGDPVYDTGDGSIINDPLS